MDPHQHAHGRGHDHEHHGHSHGAPSHGAHAHGGHGHGHAPSSFGMAFAIGTALNLGFVAAQVGFGLAAHSVALLADAVHNLGDVLGLLIAWGASVLARRHPTSSRTYGWGRGTILGSLTNAVVLLVGCGAIAVEAIGRFGDPGPVGGATVMWVAALGIFINGATALLFMRGREHDLNIKGAFLHMAADAGVSAGVVVSGLMISLTGWRIIDPVTSLCIVAVVVAGTWGLLRESMNLAMDAVPAGIDLAGVEVTLRAVPGVVDVHDLHVWALSTTQNALTAHLVQMPCDAADVLRTASLRLLEQHGINHVTIQLETAAMAEICELRPAHVI